MIKGAVFLHAALLLKRVCMAVCISTFLISINPCRKDGRSLVPKLMALQMSGLKRERPGSRQEAVLLAGFLQHAVSTPHALLGFPEASGPATQSCHI